MFGREKIQTMSTLTVAPTIRPGTLKDCKDLLTIYQTTRWLDRQYTHVGEVKQEHQGRFFRRWGWLVAEIDEKVIGEIVFRTEEHSGGKSVGHIVSIDVDVRYQKRSIGRELVSEAERILRERYVDKTVANSTPQSYNFWMKLGYFSRQALVDIACDVSTLKGNSRNGLKTEPVKSFYHLPRSLRFSNLSPVGQVAKLAAPVLDGIARGAIYEFYDGDDFVGVGVITKVNSGTADFVADVVYGQESRMNDVIIKTMRLAKRIHVKTLQSTIPKTQIEKYEGVADWNIQDSSLIPVTRLL